MGIMAEFKIREVSVGTHQGKTQLLVHGKVVASSKAHAVFANKLYEHLFDSAKQAIKR
jgi:hypothetical protein